MIVDEVDPFPGIVRKMVQLIGLPVRALDITPGVVTGAAVGTAMVTGDNRPSVFIRISGEHRHKAATRHGVGVAAQVECVEEGGQHVLKLYDRGSPATPVFPSRQSDNERNLEQFVVHPVRALEEFSVVVQRMPVVGQQTNDAVVVISQVSQGFEEPPEAVVHIGALPRVETLDMGDLAG